MSIISRLTYFPLEPILLSDELAIPALADESLYLAVDMKTDQGVQYAVMEVPSDVLGRFVAIPRGRDTAARFIFFWMILSALVYRAFLGSFDIQLLMPIALSFRGTPKLK